MRAKKEETRQQLASVLELQAGKNKLTLPPMGVAGERMMIDSPTCSGFIEYATFTVALSRKSVHFAESPTAALWGCLGVNKNKKRSQDTTRQTEPRFGPGTARCSRLWDGNKAHIQSLSELFKIDVVSSLFCVQCVLLVRNVSSLGRVAQVGNALIHMKYPEEVQDLSQIPNL